MQFGPRRPVRSALQEHKELHLPDSKPIVNFMPLVTINQNRRKYAMAGLSKAGQLQALFAASFALLLQSQVACRGESAPPGPNPPTNQVTPEGKDTNSMPWVMLEVPQINAKIPIKDLQADKDTGMQVFLVKYPAGFINTWHTHPNAHGMYVLEGTLLTHKGEFGPGSWVWFPEGGWMQHGATAKSDVTILFITNKKFGIMYPVDKNLPYPMNK
jgi:quercetin dioxygenase-like cupin family protein